MWNYWEQLRCVAHSPLIVSTKISLWNLLATCIVRRNCVPVCFACIKKLFILLTEVIISVPNAIPRVTCTIFRLNNKQVRFSWSVIKMFTFSKRRKNRHKMILETSIVQHVQTKIVCTCQPIENLVSTTIKSEKPALTCFIFHLRKKTDNNFFW